MECTYIIFGVPYSVLFAYILSIEPTPFLNNNQLTVVELFYN